MAKGVDDFRDGVDEFMSASTVLPPSTWDPKTRVDPPDNLPQPTQRLNAVRSVMEAKQTMRQADWLVTGLTRG